MGVHAVCARGRIIPQDAGWGYTPNPYPHVEYSPGSAA